jgi:hypothetical protein
MSTSVKIAQKDKHWLITGASSGFGRLLTEYLLSLDAKVVATARRVESLQDLVKQYAGNVVTLELDVTKQHSIDKAVADMVARVGHIDVLVNNAGYGVAGAVEEVTEAEYMPMFETNLFGLINVTKALLPQFRERRSGTIVDRRPDWLPWVGLLQRDKVRGRRSIGGAECGAGADGRACDGGGAGSIPHGVPGALRHGGEGAHSGL